MSNFKIPNKAKIFPLIINFFQIIVKIKVNIYKHLKIKIQLIQNQVLEFSN